MYVKFKFRKPSKSSASYCTTVYQSCRSTLINNPIDRLIQSSSLFTSPHPPQPPPQSIKNQEMPSWAISISSPHPSFTLLIGDLCNSWIKANLRMYSPISLSSSITYDHYTFQLTHSNSPNQTHSFEIWFIRDLEPSRPVSQVKIILNVSFHLSQFSILPTSWLSPLFVEIVTQ